MNQNKRKIFNDPVYGFITIPDPLIFDLIEHPWFQRLRRIRQLGLTHMVYPGALHTRFHHALGALYLMNQAIDTLRSKGHHITDDEALGALTAILLHDIGHSPFSHALENSMLTDIRHEHVSLLIMEKLNEELGGALTTALSIFKGTYPKHFLHQLVSGQLDMDRMDYLNRDSFYTGVLEGKIGAQRIIKMLDVKDGFLVVEEKGIYSIEKFIIARRLMYWQVYLHKTVLAAEQLLVKILMRARELSLEGYDLFATPALTFFLKNQIGYEHLIANKDLLRLYLKMDDYDVFTSIKVWAEHQDPILSRLCLGMVNRRLYKIRLQKDPFTEVEIQAHLEKLSRFFSIPESNNHYMAFSGTISNNAYDPKGSPIKISMKNGSILNLSSASDQLEIPVLSTSVSKYFFCFLEELA